MSKENERDKTLLPLVLYLAYLGDSTWFGLPGPLREWGDAAIRALKDEKPMPTFPQTFPRVRRDINAPPVSDHTKELSRAWTEWLLEDEKSA